MPEIDKPSNLEDEYFAREEIEKKRKLARQQSEETEAKQREELKQLHFMKCPKCGFDLHTIHRAEVEIDTCFNCHGVWLDAGELEQILRAGSEQSGGVMRAVLNVFGRK
jgi:uncharacterized protein